MAQNNVIKEIFIKKGNVNLLDKQLGAEAQNIDVSYDANGNIIEDITEPGVVINETKSLTSALLDMQDNISDKTVTWEEMDLLGSKNFLITAPDNITDNGITFIVDSNGIITMNGRASEEAIYEITLPQPINYGCKFTISCPNLAQGVSVFVLNNNDTVIGDGYFGENGKTGDDEILINNNQNIFKIRIKVRANILVSNLILKPMLRLSCIKDKNFASYAMTNKELTNEVIENKVLLKDTVGWVRKNLIPVTLDNLKINSNTNGTWNGNEYTLYGVTFTIDTDEDGNVKKITANGTSSQSFSLVLYKDYELSKGKYLLNGCPSGGGINSYRIRIGNNGASSIWVSNENNSDTPFNLDTDMKIVGVIDIGHRYTLNNVVFYPMLRHADIPDSTYEPYHKSVDVIKANREELKDTIGWSGKNLLENKATSQTIGGITYVVNNDGSVKANGTAAGASNLVLAEYVLPQGNYIASKGYPSTSSTHCGLVVEAYNGSTWVRVLASSYSTDDQLFTVDYNGYDRVRVTLKINQDDVISNLMIYPMIRKASIADSTYEPYHPTVKQTLRDAEVIEGKNLLNIVGRDLFIDNPAGLTFTNNMDGTYGITGTATQSIVNVWMWGFYNSNKTLFTLPAGNYIATDVNLYKTSAGSTGSVMTTIGGGDVSFSLSQPMQVCGVRCANAVADTTYNTTLKPMLRYATETDSIFEPYYTPLKDSKFNRSEQRVLGAKNLLIYPYTNTTKTTNGVTFTDNGDGSITVNGTATASAIFDLAVLYTIDDDVLYSGCPSTGSNSTYKLQAWDHETQQTINLYDGEAKLLKGHKYNIQIIIANGYTANNLIFKPMLRLASDPDDTYAPYAMTNRELTSEVTSSKDLLKDTVGWTGKNLVCKPFQKGTVGGVTFALNPDNSYSLSGTATENIFFKITTIEDAFVLPSGEYILSGGYSNNVFLFLINTSSGSTVAEAKASEVSFTLSAATTVRLSCFVANGTNTSGATLYPMLRKADLTDPTYEPYHASVEQTLRNAEVIEGKNLLVYPYVDNGGVVAGVTWSVDADGSIYLNGTATDTVASALHYRKGAAYADAHPLKLSAGTYALSRTSNVRVRVDIYDESGQTLVFLASTVDETTFTIPTEMQVGVSFTVISGQTYSNQKANIMLRKSSETDPTFEPYYIPLKDSKFDRSEQRVLGAKNLLKYPYGQTTKTDNGITFTDNGNGTITASGTATAQAKFFPQRREDFFAPPKGRCVASAEGLISGTSIIIEGYTSSAWVKNLTTLTPSSPTAEIDIDYTGYDRVVIYISVANGAVISNAIIIKPMLRLASDPDDTYVPYVMTNRELTDSKFSREEQAILGAKNFFNAYNPSNSSGVTITDNGKSINLLLTTPTAWINRQWDVYLPKNTDFILYTRAERTAGMSGITVRAQDRSTEIYNTGTSNAAVRTYEFKFNSGNNEFVNIVLKASGATAEAGNITYKDFMIRLASDSDSTFAPYAMTNKQLTESKDSWTGTATVNSSNQVTFTGLNDNYGYSNPCFENKLVNVTTMTKSGSGSNVTLVFTLSGASQGDVCKLRIFK